jgi:hypothetical protein
MMTYASGRSRLLSSTRIEVWRPPDIRGEVWSLEEIQDRTCQGLPRVLMQPAPDRQRRRPASVTTFEDHAIQFNSPAPRERKVVATRQLARDRLDLGRPVPGGEIDAVSTRLGLILKAPEPLYAGSSTPDTIGRTVKSSRDIDVLHHVRRAQNCPCPLRRAER